MLGEMRPSKKRDGNRHVLANSCWEILLKAVQENWVLLKDIGKPMGNAYRLLESL
jgi:hypothetical protein